VRAPGRSRVVRDPARHLPSPKRSRSGFAQAGGCSLRGNREISRPTAGRRTGGRAREVGPGRRSGEAGERCRVCGGGAGGAKGRGQGERGPDRHAPDTAPDQRVPRTGARTASSTRQENGTVHRPAPPRRRRSAALGLSPASAGSGGGSGRADVAGLRRRSGSQASGPARPRPARRLPGATIAPSLHTQAGRAAAAARHRPLEDKIVQRATVEPLNASYEEDFRGFSYGFRAGRSQHDALDALTVAIERPAVSWILDADIAGFFDMVDHAHLIRFVEHRTPASARADRRIVRLIRKWLKVGRTSEARLEVMEDGEVRPGEVGTPQGAVLSPLLANVYLHYVFDLWAHQWRQRHAQGNVIIVRYADDIPDQVRDRRLRAQGRGRAVSCGDARAPAAVRADAASGQDPPHRVRSLRGRRSKEARPWQTGELRLPWLHPRLRPPSARSLHRQTTPPPRSHAGQAAGDQGSIAAAAQPARSHELDADVRPCPSLASERPHHPSLALCPLHRHSPEVGARCSNRARRVLCGGCAVTRIPTATVQRRRRRSFDSCRGTLRAPGGGSRAKLSMIARLTTKAGARSAPLREIGNSSDRPHVQRG